MFSAGAGRAAKRPLHLGISWNPRCGHRSPPCENALMSPEQSAAEPAARPYAPYRADTLVVEHDGPVTLVTINRPERRNAVDSVCADQLREAFVAFDGDGERSVAV